MTTRQQRRLVYETAFDSRVKRDVDELDRLLLHQQPGAAALYRSNVCSEQRAASRSSFGSSTSGSSASSTPTHQPMEVVARSSPVRYHHFTPVTERRKVTLVGPRSMSPQARSTGGPRALLNQNFERRINFISNSHHQQQPWDSPVSRCSSSDKSSSQESMSVELSSSARSAGSSPLSHGVLGRSASRDSLSHFLVEQRRSSLVSSNSLGHWKERGRNNTKTEGEENPLRDNSGKEATEDGTRKEDVSAFVKVLPTDSPRFCRIRSSKSSCDLTLSSQQHKRQDPELKENNNDSPVLHHHQTPLQHHHRPQRRRSSLLSEVRPMDNLPQSPVTDNRQSEDCNQPWDLKSGPVTNISERVLRPSGVNGSVSVPERLSGSGGVPAVSGQPKLPTSMTHEKLLESDEAKDGSKASDRPKRPNGAASRPSLSLDLGIGGSSDSPRRGRQSLSLDFGCAALTAVGEKVDPHLTLEKQGWYHGSISRVEAEGKLRVLKEGSYLVRNSESSKHDYSLSLKSARGFMHMKIAPTSGGRFVLGQFSNTFTSIPEMVSHYSANKLPIKGAEHMSLLYPVIDQLL